MYEVLIVGASIAGLHAAELLARKGVRVGLFEQAKSEQTSPRTLIVTSALNQVLNNGAPATATIHETSQIEINSRACSRRIRLLSPDPIIERTRLVRQLRDAAKNAGAVINGGNRFLGLSIGNDGLTKALFSDHSGAEEEISASKAIIGADGVQTEVGIAANIGRPASVPILQAQAELPAGWDPGLTQVWFDPAKTRFFYWLIPESRNKCVVGFIGEPKTKMRVLLDSFLEELGVKAEGYQGANVAMYHPRFQSWAQVGSAHVLLVGEAAGHVKVTTVGGTVTGLVGAQAAARSILAGTPYSQELVGLKRELNLHWVTRLALDTLDHEGYDALVRAISTSATRFLGEHNRDSMSPAFWKLPILEPRLLKVGGRCLINLAKQVLSVQRSFRR